MKSRLEWLQELPEPHRTQAIDNCIAQNEPNDYMYMDKKSLKATILESFVWKHTLQGWHYWNQLYQMLCVIIALVFATSCGKDEAARPVSVQFYTGMYLIDANRILPSVANPVYDWEVIQNGSNIIILNDSSKTFPDSIYVTVNGNDLFVSAQRYEVYGLTPGDWICSGSGVVNGSEFILNLDIEYDGTVSGMQPQQWRLNCTKI